MNLDERGYVKFPREVQMPDGKGFTSFKLNCSVKLKDGSRNYYTLSCTMDKSLGIPKDDTYVEVKGFSRGFTEYTGKKDGKLKYEMQVVVKEFTLISESKKQTPARAANTEQKSAVAPSDEWSF